MSAKIKWDDAALKKHVRKVATDRLIRAAETVRTIAIKSMGSGSSGHRKYYRTAAKKEHWSANPGQAPHVDTGRLRASITWAISEGAQQGDALRTKAQSGDQVGRPDREAKRIIAVIGTNVKYARSLEFGTRHMKARPFLRPALEKARAKIKWLYE
jgi:HK97 gp10 family phage protein